MDAVFQHILFEKKNHVAYITLNNPEKKNPVGNEVKTELIQVLNICDYDDEVRAITLRGAGGCFSAGGDLKAMKERIERGELGTRISCRLAGELNTRLRNIRKPTIACVEGAAAGAGMCLMLSCDFQIVAEDTKMVFSFVNIGYVPDSGATYLVTRAVGTTRATDLLMSGRRFTGKEAAQWGLVTEAVPHEQLEERLQAYLDKYANGPTAAYGRIKAMINAAQFDRFNDGIQNEIFYQGECEETEDHKRAVLAFFEKKKPEFIGK